MLRCSSITLPSLLSAGCLLYGSRRCGQSNLILGATGFEPKEYSCSAVSVMSSMFCRPPSRTYSSPCVAQQATLTAGNARGPRSSSHTRSVSEPQERKPRSGAPRAPGLQQVPGIGKRNEQLLVAKGVTTLDCLKKLFVASDEQLLDAFLKEEVGIRNRLHRMHIVQHLSAQCEAQQMVDKTPLLTLYIEGNIGAGKSTFLQTVTNGHEGLRERAQVSPEPVHEWQNLHHNDKKHNLLQEYYQDPKKAAFPFQTLILYTRVEQEKNSRATNKEFRLLERSVFSDRMVFVRTIYESKWIDDKQLAVYDRGFSLFVDGERHLKPDGFIYLRTNPATCHRRIQRRQRSEENEIDERYLAGLHDKHEDWLYKGLIATDLLGEGNVPSQLANEVYFLNTEKAPEMPSALGGVPALVLDCDEDADLINDLDYRKVMGEKVMDYLEFIQRYDRTSVASRLSMDSPLTRTNASGPLIMDVGGPNEEAQRLAARLATAGQSPRELYYPPGATSQVIRPGLVVPDLGVHPSRVATASWP